MSCVSTMKDECDELGDDDGGGGGDHVARARVAPDGAVEPEGDEGEEARREDHRQRQVADEALARRPRPAEHDHVGGHEGGRDHDEVDQDLDQAAPVDAEDVRSAGGCGRAAAVGVCEEASELNEEREGEDDADDRVDVVVEDGVGEARAAEAEGDQREQRDRVPLGEAEAHEAM